MSEENVPNGTSNETNSKAQENENQESAVLVPEKEASEIVQQDKPDVKIVSNKENYSDVMRKRKIVLFSIAILFYLGDIISDYVLVILYGVKNEWWSCGFTFLFIILPSIVITWKGRQLRNAGMSSWWDTILVILILCFNLEPVIYYYKCCRVIQRYLKNKEEKELYKKYVNNYHNVAKLRYWEGMLEAVPQLTLQVYIIMHDYEHNRLTMNLTRLLQAGSISFSIVGLLLTIYNRYNAWLLKKSYGATIAGHVIECTKKCFPLITRVFSLAAFSSIHPEYCVPLFLIHCISMIFWEHYTRTTHSEMWETVTRGFIDSFVHRTENFRFLVITIIILLTEDCFFLIYWFNGTSRKVVITTYLFWTAFCIEWIGRFVICLHYKYDTIFHFQI